MKRHYSKLLCGAAAAAILASAGIAHAEDKAPVQFDIPAQPLTAALNEFGIQSGSAVLFKADVTGAKVSRAFTGASDPETALMAMLDGTGLSYRREGQAFVIVSASDPQSGSAAGDGADAGTVAALVVTAQKREENIQDVPIAISAFTQKSLEEQKIEGGFDLLKAIPNVTFSKNNFTSYNFSIRGIGTKAVSATTDPGVAVSFNNVSLIQNRLFEQEYFDIERVEVLRGPQGTLYGRNATAGVINVISAKPNMTEFSGWLKGEVGNYHSKRLSAMVNVPLVEDKLAIRLAGALTDRQGYDYNTVTKHAVNGRDLWSGRITVQFDPTDRIRTNLIWERFNEDDNRSRTGKQLCHRDPSPDQIGETPIVDPGHYGSRELLQRASFSTGCRADSLYDPAAFNTPNGLALPFVYALLQFTNGFYPIGTDEPRFIGSQSNADASFVTIIDPADPYGNMMQSGDLRVIASMKDPVYRAKADNVELNIDVDLGESLKLYSQTLYNKDSVYSFQDYNRFNTVPVFNDTSGLYSASPSDYFELNEYGYVDFSRPLNVSPPSPYRMLAPGGVFCDPQIGCSNTMAGFDISQAKSSQFSQEIRIQSSYDGPLNFSAGANFTRFNVLADYYVMYNLITAAALMMNFNSQGDYTKCGYAGNPGFELFGSMVYDITQVNPPVSMEDPSAQCAYIDPNPVADINGEGHNYYRSKNPYRLTSSAAFGEVYWAASPNVKVTAGLRYTRDRKRFTPYPTQVLMTPMLFVWGTSFRGLQAGEDIRQSWGEYTGRVGIDWKPEIAFTDETMIYAFYSRGYKGGGANPPRIGIQPYFAQFLPRDYEETFRPEFVNAFEVGAKNTLLSGALMFNADGFFYDYKDYQVSKVVDRSVANENFDARVWGLEFETLFTPSRNLHLNANLGYLDTSIGKDARSIDVMNRTQGDPNYVVVKPFVTFPSNCIAPRAVVEPTVTDIGQINSICTSSIPALAGLVQDPVLGGAYSPWNYPEINGGAGIYQNLKGNELPNSPHWTMNLGAQYSHDFANSWKATIRADGYWQSQSWARVYNAVNDKLHGWYNANLSLWLENDDDLKIELYAKNILDKSPITDAFINSDDSGLTTNVFTLDPRLIGLSIKKDF
ncbi:MAG: TonB-dependent receptor domain-containing protein [Ignavibacteriales bacterium]